MNKTPLNTWHHANNGRMVDFAGWEMPVQYTSIVDEHNAVRKAVGLFDISHMGRLQFMALSGGDFLNHVLTNDTSKLKVGDVRYSLVCQKDGGILDDVLVYRLSDRWVLVVNASNRTKIIDWLGKQDGFGDCGFEDQTMETGMIAIQGPNAVQLASRIVGQDLSGMKYYSAQIQSYAGFAGLVSRTGYTGEDGFELIVPAVDANRIWQLLMDEGASLGVVASGLGCRDTLRMEAAMPLYGHELSESIDPLTAGLGFAVRMSKAAFIGKAALSEIQNQGIQRVRVGLELEGRRIAREETPVLAKGDVIGRVTSGTFSPTLQKTIAMAYVSTDYAQPGTQLTVEVRGTAIPATVVALPFYKRES